MSGWNVTRQPAWEFWLCDPTGQRLAMIRPVSPISIVRSVNQPGWFEFGVPATFDTSLIQADYLIEIWRRTEQGVNIIQQIGIIKKLEYQAGTDGLIDLTIGGPGALGLLDGRIVAYKAGTTQASKTDFADDMMKAIIRENLGSSATDTDRDLSAYNLTVRDDVSLAESVDRSFAWKTIPEALAAIAAASTAKGTALYYDILPTFTSAGFGLEFATFTNQRGMDRSWGSGNPTAIFSLEAGNLENPKLELDYSDEVNYVYAGGQGEGSDREVVEVSEDWRVGRTIWSRREGFADGRNQDTTAKLTALAYTRLYNGRPKLRFSAGLKSTPATRYDIEWTLGDVVTANFAGQQFDNMITAIRATLDDNGQEKIEAKLEVES